MINVKKNYPGGINWLGAQEAETPRASKPVGLEPEHRDCGCVSKSNLG